MVSAGLPYRERARRGTTRARRRDNLRSHSRGPVRQRRDGGTRLAVAGNASSGSVRHCDRDDRCRIRPYRPSRPRSPCCTASSFAAFGGLFLPALRVRVLDHSAGRGHGRAAGRSCRVGAARRFTRPVVLRGVRASRSPCTTRAPSPTSLPISRTTRSCTWSARGSAPHGFGLRPGLRGAVSGRDGGDRTIRARDSPVLPACRRARPRVHRLHRLASHAQPGGAGVRGAEPRADPSR